MTDLTEKWKARELKTGFYYVYLKCLEMFDIAGSSTLYEILERGNEDSTEVIAPVPSYEENQQIKELLKECRSPINYALCLNLDEEEKIEFRNLLAKIKQVIG